MRLGLFLVLALAVPAGVLAQPAPLARADSLSARMVALYGEGRYAEAVPLARTVAALREAALGPDHLAVADALNNLALLLDAEGDAAEARPRYERALTLYEAALGPDHPDVATALSNLAVLLYNQDDYAAARPLHERALSIREATFGPDHPEVAASLNNLAMLLDAEGDRAAARPLLERALAVYEGALGPDHPDTAEVLANLAVLLFGQNDYAEARPLFERVLALREAALGPGHPAVAESLSHLAALLRTQGDYASARPLAERTLAIYEAVLGPEHPHVAEALSHLAGLAQAEADYATALALHERALAIREAAYGPDHPDVALSLNNVGGIHELWGDYVAARPLLERALAIYEAAYGPHHPDVALGLNNLAFLDYAQGDYAAARPLLERALALREAALGPDHPDLALRLGNLAILLGAEGRDDEARPLLDRAARILDRFAGAVLPALSAAEQRAFIDLDLPEHSGLLLSSRLGGGPVSETYALLGGWKGLLLHGLRRQTAIAALLRDPDHAEAAERLQALRAQVAQAYQDGDARLSDLSREKEALERRLADALGAGALDDPWRALGPDGLRAALPPGTAFADVYRHVRWEDGAPLRWQYTAVVTAPDFGPRLVEVGDADSIEEAVARWRDAVLGDREAETGALAAALWAPLAAALPEGTERVWLSPDAQLTRVPWAVLAEARGEGAHVAEVASPRALARLLTAEPPQSDSAPEALLVGGVAFGGDGAPFGPLLGTAAEVEALTGLAAREGVAARVLDGADATVQAVTAALPAAEYAHLATHGFFYAESAAVQAARSRLSPDVEADVPPEVERALSRNPLTESGVALAGANAGGEGRLTAEQIVGLDLSGTRLVVLSACDTGRGHEVTGQGVLGLRASLDAAGARTLLLSLWPVPDDATAFLMERFYAGLWEGGLSPAESLRRAQAAVRAEARWRAPVHWAAWVLSGSAFDPHRP